MHASPADNNFTIQPMSPTSGRTVVHRSKVGEPGSLQAFLGHRGSGTGRECSAAPNLRVQQFRKTEKTEAARWCRRNHNFGMGRDDVLRNLPRFEGPCRIAPAFAGEYPPRVLRGHGRAAFGRRVGRLLEWLLVSGFRCGVVKCGFERPVAETWLALMYVF